jgi:cytochrome c-type biogenesis protein
MTKIISTKTASPLKIDDEKKKESWLALAATFAIPAVFVVGLLFLLVSFRGGIEAGVANLALLLPVGYAFAAGMVASVNPCGVLMLPNYVFFQLRTKGASSSATRRALRALLIAAVVTAGFILIFAAVGIVIAAGGRWLVTVFPYVGIVLGAGMVGLGVWTLVSGRTLSILGGGRVTVDRQQSLGNAFLFGIAYAVGSLSCTLPIFLVVVGTSLAGEGLLFSFGQFIGYALGMGTIIFAVTIGAALFRRAMARWMRLVTPYIHRVSAMFVIGAGAYLVYYWVFQTGLVL